MTGQVLVGVGSQHAEWRPPRAGVLLRETREARLIEAEDDLVVRRDDRHPLLAAAANHFHCRRVVIGDVSFLEGDVVTAKELLSSIAPWSGLRRVHGHRSCHQHPSALLCVVFDRSKRLVSPSAAATSQHGNGTRIERDSESHRLDSSPRSPRSRFSAGSAGCLHPDIAIHTEQWGNGGSTAALNSRSPPWLRSA